MKPRYAMLLLLFLTATVAKAQEFYVQDTTYGFNIDIWAEKHITSLSQLPKDIRHIVDGVFTERIPPCFDGKVRFLEGVNVDLKRYFSRFNSVYHSTLQVDHRWVMPAYDLWFSYVDSQVGVKAYAVELQLDQYGQVLSLNLPENDPALSQTVSDSVDARGRHHKRYEPPERSYRLIPLQTAIDSARVWAVSSHLLTKNCSVDLHYDQCSDKLWWQVAFRQKMIQGQRQLTDLWQVYDIRADNLEFVKTYEENRGWIE